MRQRVIWETNYFLFAAFSSRKCTEFSAVEVLGSYKSTNTHRTEYHTSFSKSNEKDYKIYLMCMIVITKFHKICIVNYCGAHSINL